MIKMRRVIAGVAFAATIALSLAATQGTAWAASIDPRDGMSVDSGRRTTPPPTTVAPPPSGGGIPTAFGVTWED
jgi:hypothetical protein